jgi:hypothetical protein
MKHKHDFYKALGLRFKTLGDRLIWVKYMIACDCGFNKLVSIDHMDRLLRKALLSQERKRGQRKKR